MTRVAVAGLMYEANSFAPGAATLDDFRRRVYVHGPESFMVGAGGDEFAGARRAADREGIELFPTTLTLGAAGPVVTADAYRALRERLLDGLRPCAGRIDGVYLRLHGAMVADGCDDPEGEIIGLVRDLVGPDIPIAVSLDLHTHFTARMAAGTDLIAGFRTQPHVDYAETGARALRLLAARLRGARPRLAFRKIPVMSAAEAQDTNSGPLAPVFARLGEIAGEPGIMDVSMFLTQPWLDVPGAGWSAVVVTDGDRDLAQRRADELAGMLWDRRHDTLVRKTPVREALAAIATDPAGEGSAD